ncbi:MAG: hypothetical protein ACRD5Z_01280, partial [Bryobacteraceae bacterium]
LFGSRVVMSGNQSPGPSYFGCGMIESMTYSSPSIRKQRRHSRVTLPYSTSSASLYFLAHRERTVEIIQQESQLLGERLADRRRRARIVLIGFLGEAQLH